jgi:peroxiredoxin
MSTTSTTTTEIRAAHGVRPTQPAPDLTVPLLRGGTYRASDQRPKLFTMVVFFRGLHCPVCRAQLSAGHACARGERQG